MKIQSIVTLFVAIIFAAGITIAQTKDDPQTKKETAKKENCCPSQKSASNDISKDCCKDAKSTAAKTDCVGKDGEKKAACCGEKKSETQKSSTTPTKGNEKDKK